MSTLLFPIPPRLEPPASDIVKLLDAKKYAETAADCQKHLAALEPQLPPRYTGIPGQGNQYGAVYQYYALTLILANALAELKEWKTAKEVLGKYRVHFPRDPWGFSAGAEVTRRDTQINDKAAVDRAVELLQGEAERLQSKM